jgi:protease I
MTSDTTSHPTPDLTGRRVLAVVTTYGVEQDELVVPLEHLRAAGAHVDVAAPERGTVETLVGDKDPGRPVEADRALGDLTDADLDSYDLLLVPGGTINADALRLEEKAVAAVGTFARSGRPVAAICHGPWLVVEAGLATGKTLTSYPTLQTDVRNAGGTWQDQSVVSDASDGWTLVTSRTPDDLDDFLREVDAALAAR